MLNALDKGSSYSQQLENKNNFLKEIWLQLGLKREVFQRAVCHMDREEGYEKE